MIEWDDASYERKFANSFIVLKEKKGVDTACGWCTGISRLKADLAISNTMVKEYSLKQYEVHYQYFPAGFVDISTLLMRRVQRQWCTGLAVPTHHMYTWDASKDRWAAVGSSAFTSRCLTLKDALLTYPNKAWDIKTSIKTYGPISPRFYLGLSTVWYLDTKIGSREGSKITLDYKVFRQELQDLLLEAKCQIS